MDIDKLIWRFESAFPPWWPPSTWSSSDYPDVRHSERADRLVCRSAVGRIAPDRPERRAQAPACEGPKRTTTGSQPDIFPFLDGDVLDKDAAFCMLGKTAPRPA